MTPWCPAIELKWYEVIIVSAHGSGTAGTAVSFSGVILNNSESNRMCISVNLSTFLIATLEVGNFCTQNIDTCSLNKGCLNIHPVFLLLQPANVCL